MRQSAKKFVVESRHEGKLPLAYPRRVFRDGIKYWLDIMRRDRDDAQDFSGFRLQLARLVQLTGEPHDLGFLAGSGGTAMAHS